RVGVRDPGRPAGRGAQQRARRRDPPGVPGRVAPRPEGCAVKLKSLRGFVPLIVLLALWQLLGDTNSPTLPSPSQWWPAFKTPEQRGALWPALEKTLVLFAESLAVATLIGVSLGIALGASPRLRRGLSPLLEFMRTTPAAAIVPAAIIVFGISEGT